MNDKKEYTEAEIIAMISDLSKKYDILNETLGQLAQRVKALNDEKNIN